MSIDNIAYIRISPGIGMARLGNSDTDYIGPESPGIGPDPSPGGFKDSEGKVKPMSARFRVYGYDLNGNPVMELTSTTPGVNSMEWNVHMANKKAANYAFQGKFGFKSSDLRNPGVQPGMKPDDRDQLIIDPGPKTLSGINVAPIALTDTIFNGITEQVPIPTSNFLGHYGEQGNTMVTYAPKSVTIGWLKTDAAGRLVVVGGKGEAASMTTPSTVIQKGPGYFNPGQGKGGTLNSDPNSNGNLYFNNPGWYDDTGAGPVNVTVSLIQSTGPIVLNTVDDQTLSNGTVIKATNKRAWVSVAPPKFAPAMANVVSLADLQYNIFPEADPNAGSLMVATVNQDFIGLYNSKSGSTFGVEPIGQSTNKAGYSPAIATLGSTFYCAYTSEDTNPNQIVLATSDTPTVASSFTYSVQSADVKTDYGPAVTVLNSTLLCAVVANASSSAAFQNKVVIGATTGTTLSFNAITLKLATPTGLQDFPGVPDKSVALAAYNGQLYMALTLNGVNYLGVSSPTAAYQFNFQAVGSSTTVSHLSPSLAAYDGLLYYAITDSSGAAQFGSLDLNGPQRPLDPSSPDKTPPFEIEFAPVNGAVQSQAAPAITAFNGKLYCLVLDTSSTATNGHLYAKGPLLHVNDNGTAKKQEAPFSQVTTLDCGAAQPALAAFEVVNFYRDILPVLRTVTDNAYVNELAFKWHGPKGQANFLRGPYLDSIANPNRDNNPTRVSVYQFIRPGEWITEVPPPPQDFSSSAFPSQTGQQGTLMPHLAGTGGSVDENIFNDTQFPSQWLSLTRHQLAKFQKWVNGQFVSGAPLPAPTPVDQLPITEQPSALDLAALELTVGGGFHPGIELTYYMAYPEYFAAPFRFTDQIMYQGQSIASVTPGSIAGYMSVPWHGDFWSCNTDFWPPQRPDIAVQNIQGVPTPVNWFRSSSLQIPETASSDTQWLHGENPGNFDGNHTTYQTFARYWSYFGFIVEDGSQDQGEDVWIETERSSCLDGSSPSTCDPVNPGETVPVIIKPMTIENGRYQLSGRVVQGSAGVAGLIVEAFDHDLLSADDKLGSATTDSNGAFSIHFSQSDFSALGLDKQPDVYFKVFDGTVLKITTKDQLLKNLMDAQDPIVINLPSGS